MTRISLAPELSATLSRVSCWTINPASGGPTERFGAQVVQLLGAAEHRSERMRACVSEERRLQRRRWAAWAPKIRLASPEAGSLLRLLHDFEHAPALLLGDGARFGDADEVAHAALVLLVVDLEPRALLHGLAVQPVGLRRAHLDDHGLVHLVGDDGAEADLALASLLCRRRRHGFLVGRHQDGSSVLALRVRFGLGASAWASGSKPSSAGFSATATAAASCGTKVTSPSWRSLSTVMMRAMSWRTFEIWLEFSSWPTACLKRSSYSSRRAVFMRSAN